MSDMERIGGERPESPETGGTAPSGETVHGAASAGAAEARGEAPGRGRRRIASYALAGALLFGAVGGGVVGSAATVYWTRSGASLPARSAVAAPLSEAAGLGAKVGLSFPTAAEGTVAAVYKQVSPAVVTVSVRQNGTRPSARLPGELPSEGEGTGFVVDAQGRILTNNHVVDGADEIVVRMLDGTELPAKLVGSDPASDLALLQAEIPSDKLVVASLGDSDAVQPGDPAIAIGSPFGLDHSVTAGIVSGVGRVFGTAAGRPMRGLIQTDTPINPGNSGGPLLNAAGEVIGIATSIESPVRGSVGVGFAIPVNTAKRLLPQLTAGQEVDHPWLGISGIAITPSLAERLGLPTESGVLVAEVTSGGPAAKAGLRPADLSNVDPVGGSIGPVKGDIIVAVDDQPVTSTLEISSYLDGKSVGDSVTLKVLRDGKEVELKATLGAWPISDRS